MYIMCRSTIELKVGLLKLNWVDYFYARRSTIELKEPNANANT